MNLRELFEASLIGTLGRELTRDVPKAGAKKVAKQAEMDVAPIAKVGARAEVDAQTKEKEKKGGVVGIIFGRFNPPHKGHKHAWQMASKCPVWYVGTNKDTQGPKDPLPYEVKIEAMKAIWSGIEGHVIEEQSWLTLASHCYASHKDAKTLFCFTDEDWVTKTIIQYNGVQGQHGFYKFDNIEQKVTPRLSSATELRSAVRANDRRAFEKAAGVSADTLVAGHPFFDVVSHYLSQYPEKAPRNTKIKEVNDVVRALREAKKGKMKPIDKTQKAAMKNAMTLPALNMSTGSGGAYMNYRMGIALAGAPDFPAGGEADNWIGGDPLISSYTEEEFNMVKAAAKQVGAGTIQNWSGKRSEEVADVNKTSTVAKPKRNKYGI